VLPNPDNFVEIDKERVDTWGVPALVHCQWRDNEKACCTT
jgi:hypothetical protein